MKQVLDIETKADQSKWYKLHTVTSKIVGIFIIVHLINHLAGIFGPAAHIQFMEIFRTIYRSTVGEGILLISCLIQIITGVKLVTSKSIRGDIYDKLQRWSGIYIGFFLLAHISAVLVLARVILDVDSNIHFGAAGLVTMPFKLLFIPYYSLAIISFGVHIACSLRKVTGKRWGQSTGNRVFQFLFFLTVGITIIIIMIFSGVFYEIELPDAYKLL